MPSSWVSLGSSETKSLVVDGECCGCGLVGAVEKKLVEEVRQNGTLIVVGETGSGKTTRKCVATILFLPLLIVVWVK